MSPESEEKGKKRHRRTAQEIERKYRCEAPSCRKAYGSEGALKMHIRLKHAEGALVPFLRQEDHQENEVSSPATLSCSTPSSYASSTPNSPFVPEKVETTPEAACLPAAFSYDPHSLPQEPAEIDYNDFKEFRERYCHIPLLRLNIGLWQAESQCCGDLVAKFSYKERTILWEIFDVGSLLRAVVPFDDLNGVGLELHHDDTGTMVIELRCAPTFYKGVLQPHESTIWTQIGDFTEGMASTFRRHILHFSRRALNEPIEDIFRRDPRLQGLLLQGLPALKSPYFVPEL
jgi:hypothetical protein